MMADQLEYSIVLKHLKLTNFRCFQDLEVDFDEKLTVFIAENGGGKTAILDAVAEGLRGYLSYFKIKGYEKSILPSKDIKIGTSACAIGLDLNVSYVFSYKELSPDRNDKKGIKDTGELDGSQAKLNSVVKINEDGGYFEVDRLSPFTEAAKDFNIFSKESSLPVLVYYGGDSVHVAEGRKKKWTQIERLYDASLSSSRFNYGSFKDWFDKRYKKFMQTKISKPQDEVSEVDPELTILKNAIEYILNDVEEGKRYEDIRMDYSMDMERIVIGKLNDNKKFDPFEIAQLSAGEKSLVAFVTDLGLRLLHGSPPQSDKNRLKGVKSLGYYKIHGKGIVLIDEVDLHLHPKWQRKVVGKLMDIFPEVQWVMTTHSPLVLSGLPSEQVRVLESNKIYGSGDTLGHGVEEILEDVMQTDASPHKDEIDELFSLISTNQLEEAKKLKSEIERKVEGRLPDLVKATAMITKKELLSI